MKVNVKNREGKKNKGKRKEKKWRAFFLYWMSVLSCGCVIKRELKPSVDFLMHSIPASCNRVLGYMLFPFFGGSLKHNYRDKNFSQQLWEKKGGSRIIKGIKNGKRKAGKGMMISIDPRKKMTRDATRLQIILKKNKGMTSLKCLHFAGWGSKHWNVGE